MSRHARINRHRPGAQPRRKCVGISPRLPGAKQAAPSLVPLVGDLPRKSAATVRHRKPIVTIRRRNGRVGKTASVVRTRQRRVGNRVGKGRATEPPGRKRNRRS